MRRARRLYKPEFKSKVALTAIKGELTMAEMAKKFDVQTPQTTQWKKQLLACAGDAFVKGDKNAEDSETTVLELRAKVGELTMEVNFLARGLERNHGPSGRS